MPFANKNQFRQIADSIPQLVWTARPDGYIDYYNKQWYDYTGFDESYGDQSWVPLLHPDDAALCVDTWYNSVRTGEGYVIEYRFNNYRNPGSYRWFLGRAHPIRNDKGEIVKWFGTCTDIDDRKRQEEELERRVLERTQALDRLTAELQQSNQNLQQFAYIASHDLQEPLRKIQSFGDLLLNQFGTELPMDGVNMIQRMQMSATRMSTLIRDLLKYSRLAAANHPLELIYLNPIVSEVLDDLESAVQASQAVISVDPLPAVRGNALQLRQLFQNLLANALKFHKEMESPQIQVSCRSITRSALPDGLGIAAINDQPYADTQLFWEISVTDNGIGFDEKYASRIFNVFERLHSKQHYEGTGIGLAICQKVVAMHGGAITVRSRPAEGATFFVFLPA